MKKNQKIIISLLLCMTFIFATFAVTSFAADALDVVLKADKKEAQAGDTVTVNFEFSVNPGVMSYIGDLIYDTEAFEYVADSAKTVKAVDDFADMVSAQHSNNKIRLNFGAFKGDPFTNTGVMMTAQFKVKDGVKGEKEFTVKTEQALGADKKTPVEHTDSKTSVKIVVAVDSVQLDKSEITLEKGKTEQLIATLSPDGAEASIKWTSSDKNTVTVDDNGKITAVKAGQAVIKASAGGKEATCKVTVTSKLTGISIPESIALSSGKKYELKVTFDPEDTTDDKTVTWVTSDANIATVNNGLVTAVSNGTAVITAKCGEFTAECNVTVKDIPISEIKLNKTEITLSKGEKESLRATILPENTTETGKKVIWTSSDQTIVTVSDRGEIEAISGGVAVITAKIGDVEAKCRVTVEYKPATSIRIENSSIEIKVGEKADIGVKVNPSDTTDEFTFTSSDKNVAVVDKNGTVTAKGEGISVITVKVGNLTAKCTVTVEKSDVDSEIKGITISQTELTLTVGQEQTLSFTVDPEGKLPQSIVWFAEQTEDGVTSPVTVSDKGVVTAVAPGQINVVVIVDGMHVASCKVTVTESAETETGEVTGDDTTSDPTEETTSPESDTYAPITGDTVGDITTSEDPNASKNSGTIFKIILIIIIILILAFIAITIIYFMKKRNAYDDDEYDDDDDFTLDD